MAGLCQLYAVFTPSRVGPNSTFTVLKLLSTQSFTGVFTPKLRASFSSVTITEPALLVNDDKVTTNKNILLACPICFEPFNSSGATQLSVNTAPDYILSCCTCRKEYFGNKTHLNLTVASGSDGYDESMPASTEIFRTPVVSYLYERGWRQTFSVLGGFPGPEKEFEMMKKYFKPVLGGNIVDASCGSGLFSRLFAKSGLFSFVVALDFSENMLHECFKFIKEEKNFPVENFILVRADISRLPLATSSIDAVHAGAALHCWPSPSAAVAEISRVLRPGGVFVATTYILDGLYSLIPLMGSVRQVVPSGSTRPIFLLFASRNGIPVDTEKEASDDDKILPSGVETLLLWQPEDCEGGNNDLVTVAVDPLLVKYLGPCKREGVQFFLECVSGLCSAPNIHGFILAGDMSLGNTLQSFILLCILLHQGFDGNPVVREAVYATPTNLISKLEAEIKKRVGEQVRLVTTHLPPKKQGWNGRLYA